jgi:HPt (histidine-containing phosphotransfer) domain-containing protein
MTSLKCFESTSWAYPRWPERSRHSSAQNSLPIFLPPTRRYYGLDYKFNNYTERERDQVPTDQPETNDAFAQRLQAVFADEARTHLAMVDAGLAGLTQISTQAPTREATQAALVLGLQEALHTLKGAARAVGLGELEYLCAALATAIAAPGASGHFSAARLAQVKAAADLAGQLLAPPSARVRNQAMALAGQLEALAAPPSDYLKTT